jgi:amidase
MYAHMHVNDAIFVERLDLGGDGPTVAIKDTIDIAGTRTRAGSAVRDDVAPATRNADVVDTLLAAGCRIVGKTNLHEFAYGITGVNAWSGTPRNPRFPDRVPGGSSSGSAAAVAAGLVDFAVGTDTGGSIRIPAACCGIVGLKPTFGRVSRAGVMPSHTTLDCVGPLARSVATIERAMTMLDPTFVPEDAPASPVFALVRVDADSGVATAVEDALHATGARQTTVALASMDAAFDAGLTLIADENWKALGPIVDDPRLGADIRERVRLAGTVTPDAVAEAERVRATFAAEVDRALEDADALVLPTLPDPPLTLEAVRAGGTTLRVTAFVRPFNLSGHPAVSLPLAARDGYAPGLQLVGRRGGDAALCALARALERSLASVAS